MTDFEIAEMRKQMNREEGIEPEDGGVNVGDTDGITNEPADQKDQEPDDDTGVEDEQ